MRPGKSASEGTARPISQNLSLPSFSAPHCQLLPPTIFVIVINQNRQLCPIRLRTYPPSEVSCLQVEGNRICWEAVTCLTEQGNSDRRRKMICIIDRLKIRQLAYLHPCQGQLKFISYALPPYVAMEGVSVRPVEAFSFHQSRRPMSCVAP